MTARWTAFGLWAAVAASALYWGLRAFAPAPAVPPGTRVVAAASVPQGELSRLLGVDAPDAADEVVETPEAARFQLIGVVAPRGGGSPGGVALIAVDGKPPRAYRVGAALDEQLVLKSVHARGAAIGPRDGPPRVALDLPPPAPAATGSLPPAGLATFPGQLPPGMASPTVPVLPTTPGQATPRMGPPPGGYPNAARSAAGPAGLSVRPAPYTGDAAGNNSAGSAGTLPSE